MIDLAWNDPFLPEKNKVRSRKKWLMLGTTVAMTTTVSCLSCVTGVTETTAVVKYKTTRTRNILGLS
jgi:hypothetical protein